MNIRMLGRTTVLALLVFAFIGASGCGYKNKPIPPEEVVPIQINDLRYSTNDEGVKLTWSFPVKTIRGAGIENISSFQLYRAEIPLKEYCGSCPIPFGEPMALNGGVPFDGQQRRIASHLATKLRSGHKYFYKVRAKTSWWADSDDSNIITFVWFEPASSPQGLKAIASDKNISLKWQPVTSRADGKPLDMNVKYQVMRSQGGKDFKKIGKPIVDTRYIDKNLQNGQKYFYTVQSIVSYEGELAEGGVSEKASAVPVDLTPPDAPEGVTAVSTDVGIKVFWDQSDSRDLGGYKIYRREADTKGYTLVGTLQPEFTLFVDNKASDEIRYYYAVTAIDTAQPPNESKKSKEATIRY